MADATRRTKAAIGALLCAVDYAPDQRTRESWNRCARDALAELDGMRSVVANKLQELHSDNAARIATLAAEVDHLTETIADYAAAEQERQNEVDAMATRVHRAEAQRDVNCEQLTRMTDRAKALQADVNRLTRERDEARAELAKLESDDNPSS